MLQLNIRQKVVLTTVAAVVAAIAIISVFSLNSSRDIILEGTIDRELPAILGEVANDIDAQLIRPITIAKTMANNTDYAEFIRQSEPQEQTQALTQYLSQINHGFNTFTAFLVSAKSGSYYTPAGLFKTLSPQDEKDRWFYGFVESGKAFDLSLDIDEQSKVPTLFINYRMQQNGETLAVTGVGLTLDSMASTIGQYKIREQGSIFLVDQNGTIKLHKDPSLVGKHINMLGDIDTGTLLNQAPFATSEYDKTLLASRYLPKIGWYVVAEVPSAEVFSAIDKVTWVTLWMGLGIAVLFTIISAWIINHLIAPFGQVADVLEDIGKGGSDLSRRLDISRRDETGKIAAGYNSFVEYISELLRQISLTGDQLYKAIEAIDGQAKTMEQKIAQQASEIEQVATAIHQMGVTAEEIANSANRAADTAKVANSAVSEGGQSVNNTVSSVSTMAEHLQQTSDTISQLAVDASSIDSVLEVIRGVSEQTNLLALNAAIEAARAGEQGRGFSVVADEVRVLASRSHQSTEEIREIIEKLQSNTQDVVHAISKSTDLSAASQTEANNSGQQLDNISENIAAMNDMSLQIASATGEQSNVVSGISPHVVSIAEISRNNSETVKQTSSECGQLKEMASELKELVSKFRF
ncbi:methyl-accepting chemotaxis protein [Pontibacterium sp.]|uniref:methyl-accepting chemotaxis protein n=1 Tax=Pontibacterium sp. TaxID=2036026 RepID=UPI00351727BB